jgi:hypothetical protein
MYKTGENYARANEGQGGTIQLVRFDTARGVLLGNKVTEAVENILTATTLW